ncbi:MAG TPA: PKD domain-containing protein [Chitinophagales bacterium]|nr:PKD domain-containing protein [Chitinophagales bacterium]
MNRILPLLLLTLAATSLMAQGTIVGKSSYDVQTNNGTKNRIRVYDDGSVSAIWTGSTDYTVGTTWPDRGMFYNHSDGVTWGAVPAARVEANKTGFGELMQVEDHEVIVAHDGIDMRLYANSSIGSNDWTELGGSGPGGMTGFWPMADCPAGTDDIYVIHANANPPTALYFSRSDDGGNSWSVLNYTLPLLDAAYGMPGMNTGLTTAAETYQIKVHGADVYVLFGIPNSDLVLLHSDNYGNDGSWERQVLIDFPFDEYTGTVQTDIDLDGITDTVDTHDGYHDMIMEDDGILHVFSGYTRLYSDAGAFSYTYNYNAWGIWHWMTGMPSAELIDTRLDWINDECDNDAEAGLGAYRFTYRYSSNTTSPGAAWDPLTGRIYLLYTMQIEYTDIYDDPLNLSAQSRRDIFGMYSDDDGTTWTKPANLTMGAELDEENFFLFLNEKVVGGKVHAIWQQDELPGSAAGEADPIDTNYIRYATWDAEAFAVTLPTADFTYTSDLSLFNFTDGSSDNFPCYYWDFGDGETSDFVNPSHIYDTGGSYEVCLTVSNPYGSDTYCETVTVPGAPETSFTWSGDPDVSFTDLTLNEPTYWSWNFGDGSTSTEQNPVHSYAFNGAYNVCLTTSNALGSDTYCATVSIGNAIGAPVADFTYTITGLAVELTDISSNAPDTWSWNFGDGTTSADQDPSHTYAAAGTYNICLTVTNAVGGDTECKSVSTANAVTELVSFIQVFPNPTAGLVTVSWEGTNPELLQLYDGQGRLVDVSAVLSANGAVLNMQPLASGVYQLQLIAGNEQAIISLIRE